ncbi:MAG: aminopeptidase P family protein [Bacteroidota bacterium]
MTHQTASVDQRIAALRQQMKQQQIDAYLIPSSDPHQSEYVAEHWKAREWLSGFSGSAGTVVVTASHAGLWTDSRYFLQAETQLAESEVVLHKQKIPHAPEHINWIAEQLPSGSKLGLDGRLFSVKQLRRLAKAFQEKSIDIDSSQDLLDQVWDNRPRLPKFPIFEHELQYAGLSRNGKLAQLRGKMTEHDCGYHLISTLDDIAWLFNLRGKDVDCNPVFIAYALIGEKIAYLFLDSDKLDEDLQASLRADGVLVKQYNEIESFLQRLDEKVLIDRSSINVQLFNCLQQAVSGPNICSDLKAVKSTSEIEHIRQAMRKDGVALTRLFRWLEQELDKRTVSEFEVSEKLIDYRSQQEGYHGESFPAIVGYKGNGAIVHYRPMPDTSAQIHKEGILLLDSGGQYLDGTTDITRTIALSEPTEEQKRNFTLVLKGYISLDTLRFPQGTMGIQMDVLARQHLWQQGLNYGHGTGHGVGFFLNVHESPQGFAPSLGARGTTVFQPGMLTSNEPGFYKTDEYGIRIENLVVCQEYMKTAYGIFLSFEAVTLFPIDRSLIATDLLTPQEKQWLNAYHKEVFDKLSPLLTEEEKDWMADKCQAI